MYLQGRFSFELVWSGRYSKGSSESVRKDHPDYVATRPASSLFVMDTQLKKTAKQCERLQLTCSCFWLLSCNRLLASRGRSDTVAAAVSKAWKLAGWGCSFLETSWLAQKVRFPTLSSLLYIKKKILHSLILFVSCLLSHET